MRMEKQRGEFTISTDPSRLDVNLICDFLRGTYWASQRPREAIEKSLRHSCCFGVYHGHAQVGFARAVTDYATFAYLADVFILEPYRGQGLGKWLMKTIFEDSDLGALRRWCLITQDAHELYRPVGFRALENPERYMERLVECGGVEKVPSLERGAG